MCATLTVMQHQHPTSEELWQLYDENAQPLPGKGAPKDEVGAKGLLHGASHIWIWRLQSGKPEVLVQKRAAYKNTWPNYFDISAAGHIDLGEDPLETAVRETYEELGLLVEKAQLQLLGIHRARLTSQNKIENEFQWIYLLQQTEVATLHLQTSELTAAEWVPFETFKSDCMGDTYVPHGADYYERVISAITAATR